MDYKLPNIKIHSNAIFDICEGVASSQRGLSFKDICNYIGKNEKTTKAGILIAIQLRIIEEENGIYKPVSRSKSDFVNIPKNQKKIIMQKYLLRYKPFIHFWGQYDLGDSISDASRKIWTLYYDEKTKVDIISQHFITMGKFIDLIKYNQRTKEIKLEIRVDKIPSQYIKELEKALVDKYKTRFFLMKKLGDTFSYLEDEDIDLLADSLINFEKNCPDSIENAGTAFENFMIKFAQERNIDLINSKGLGKKINKFREEKMITATHSNIGIGLNALRIRAVHPIEDETKKYWRIKPESSIEIILSIISIIRSYYEYLKNEILEY